MTSYPTPHGVPFVKGHGTGNDFVILSDLDGDLQLAASHVVALCDRRRGLGADGVLVVARTTCHPEVAAQADAAPYFMDYRNADGSLAEMCGNGSRVFAAHLIEQGLVDAGPMRIATRGGSRLVDAREPGTFCVDMGPAVFPDLGELVVRPQDVNLTLTATGVLMPNPHAVAWVGDPAEAGRLLEAPGVSPSEAFPQGVNVEFVQEITPRHVVLRVFERGVGETLSCGTGACAAAVATLRRAGERPDGQAMRVDVPGGTLEVRWRADGEVQLTGPAVLVARGHLDRDWWAANG